MNIYQDIITSKRAPSRRPKMARADRAKIFAPFAALKGFEESVHARELRYVPRPELCGDRAEQLDRRLRSLRSGDTVTVTWFQHLKQEDGVDLGEYRVSTGGYAPGLRPPDPHHRPHPHRGYRGRGKKVRWSR